MSGAAAVRGASARAQLKQRVESLLASALVGSVYGVTLLFARLRGRPRPPSGSPRRVVVIGTFYNTNWFLSHAIPLTRCGIEELVVVTDEPQERLERVTFVCPPSWCVAAFGRTLAKLAFVFVAGLKHDPDLYMGYHLMPGAVMALLAGRAFGRPACYQMTGGPVEVSGGGFASENPVLARLGRAQPWLERLTVGVVRQFEQVVVRGASARRFLLEKGVDPEAVAIIPGSVDPKSLAPPRERSVDLVFVGRLVELKQPLQFVEILAAVSRRRPSARGAVVGGGPLLAAMQEHAAALGVADRLEFAGKVAEVQDFLARSRVFVLTSRTEGLSIAMAEAMMAGVVPVVANVGDLGDLVRHGVNGYLVEPNQIESFARVIEALLEEPPVWSRLSAAAVASAQGHVGLDHVAGLWKTHLEATFARTAEPAPRRAERSC